MDYIPSIGSSRFGSSNRLSKFSANNLTTDIRRRPNFVHVLFICICLFTMRLFDLICLCFFSKGVGWDGGKHVLNSLYDYISPLFKVELSFHLKFNKTTHIHLHLIDTKYL